MVAMLKRVCARLYIAPVRSERSWGLAEMEEFVEAGRVIRCGSITEALQKALSSGENVVVTGSFYTVGEVRETLVCQGL